MSKRETETTRWGEMLDLIACDAIYQGGAKNKKGKMSLEKIFRLK